MTSSLVDGAFGSLKPPAAEFTSVETHVQALRPKNRFIAHSEGLGWRNVYLSNYVDAPYEGWLPAQREPLLIYHVGEPAEISRVLDGERETKLSGPRQFTFVPGGAASEWVVPNHPELFHVYLRQSLLDGVVAEVHDADPGRCLLLPRFAAFDPLLEQLALAMAGAVRERPPGHALYVDCLALAMAAHLVQHHSTLTRPARLPAAEAAGHHRMRRVVDYVEANLAGDLSLDEVAAVAGLGVRHLTRSFKAAFGTTLHGYVVERRVKRAQELLRATDLPLAQVALACGFADQSKLALWFKRNTGTTPAVYRIER